MERQGSKCHIYHAYMSIHDFGTCKSMEKQPPNILYSKNHARIPHNHYKLQDSCIVLELHPSTAILQFQPGLKQSYFLVKQLF